MENSIKDYHFSFWNPSISDTVDYSRQIENLVTWHLGFWLTESDLNSIRNSCNSFILNQNPFSDFIWRSEIILSYLILEKALDQISCCRHQNRPELFLKQPNLQLRIHANTFFYFHRFHLYKYICNMMY